MIELLGNGMYKCFKCKGEKPLESFTYNDKLEQRPTFEDDLKSWVDYGYAWACEDCFLKSEFVQKKLGDNDDADKDLSFLTQCFKCETFYPAWCFSVYNKWVSEDDEKDGKNAFDDLHTYWKQHGIRWGCVNCFSDSGLCASRVEVANTLSRGIVWKANRGVGRVQWKDICKARRAETDAASEVSKK